MKKTFPNSNENPDLDDRNTIVQVNISTSQSIFNIPCEAEIQVHNETFFSSKFCGNFSSQIDTNIKVPHNMVVLRHFFANNHSLLDDLQNSNELNQSINARLPELAVESAEFEHLLASETQSELDFEVALNALISQKTNL